MEKREIKFRSWDKENKEYVPGYFTIGNDGVINAIDCGKDMQQPCHPEDQFILEQFTGLKDKNGKEIYEGDIVNMHMFIEVGGIEGSREGEQEDIGYISIEPMGVAINCKSQEDSGYLLWLHGLHDDSFEVIGNIYQNKNML